MPELPEVETIKRQLNLKLKAKKIKLVKIGLPKLIKTNLNQFKQKVIGSKIIKVWRRAKILIIDLDNGFSILTHLKMSGQLIYNGQPEKHTYLIYFFEDKTKLLFNDMRQFGYVKLISQTELKKNLEEKFGPEPLTAKFNLNSFKEILKKRKQARIKTLLMNPQFIAGIGNIYSDEILFQAKVKPTRKAGHLSQPEIERIFKGIKQILTKAIKHKGTTAELNDKYRDAAGQKGNYSNFLKIYRKTGQKCPRCRGEIEKLKIGGRSAHFCSQCQK